MASSAHPYLTDAQYLVGKWDHDYQHNKEAQEFAAKFGEILYRYYKVELTNKMEEDKEQNVTRHFHKFGEGAFTKYAQSICRAIYMFKK